MEGMFAALGRAVSRHPRVVLAGWALLAALCAALATGALGGTALFDNLDEGAPAAPGEALDGFEILQDTSDGTSFVGTAVSGVDLADPAVLARLDPLVAAARAELADEPSVIAVADPFALPAGDPRRDALIAADGDGFLVSVRIEAGAPITADEAVQQRLDVLVSDIGAAVPGAHGSVGGGLLVYDEITEQVEEDLRRGELIALPLSLLVMVVVFGGFLAAGIPILGAFASIVGALACLLGFSYLLTVDTSVVTVVSVLGLGLCIDYGLLIVSRYREELGAAGSVTAGGAERDRLVAAMAATMATAGRTVAFSGVTVALSLGGLLVFEAPVLRAMGAAGLSVVLVAMLVALTLVPALLAVGGAALDRPGALMRLPVIGGVARRLGGVAADDDGAFSAVARRVQRRPILVTLLVAATLAALALPAARLDVRASGIGLLPVGNEQRQFFDTFDADYPVLSDPDVTIVAATTDAVALAGLVRAVGDVPGVAGVESAAPLGVSGGTDYSAIDVRLDAADPAGQEGRQSVRDIRAVTSDSAFATYVTGDTAILVDLVQSIRERAPISLAIVVLATLVLLFAMTGSVLIPVKALVMNLLSLGAALGVTVLIFQDGNLEGLLGFTAMGGLEVIIAPLVLAFGFGLSMDYEMFLLSRIKELRDQGLGNDEAVALGLQRSGRIITSAALILVIVFAGFATGQLLVIKQMGIALAVAIALDATLVRVLLVPSTMTLLREWNWWAPGPLRRLHHRLFGGPPVTPAEDHELLGAGARS